MASWKPVMARTRIALPDGAFRLPATILLDLFMPAMDG
jgi:CheY-like chemotaxis protein